MTEKPTVFADGSTMSPQEVMMVAQQRAIIDVSQDAWPGIHAARSVVERIVATGETVYGINTGFGALVHERISSEDLSALQVNLIRSHATALGENMTVEAVRAMMVVRLNSLCKGHSGIHPIVSQLVLYLNNDIHPVIPRIGSLGASGDLAPSHTSHWHSLGRGMSLLTARLCPRNRSCLSGGSYPLSSPQRTVCR